MTESPLLRSVPKRTACSIGTAPASDHGRTLTCFCLLHVQLAHTGKVRSLRRAMQSRRLFCEVAAGILAAESRLRRTVRFGDCVLDPASGEFEREGARRRLQEQPLRVLELLTMRPGEVVTREELVACLWPTGTVVDFDTGLNTAVRKLRAALGDDANAPRYVETIPRRGYRLLVPAVVEAASTEALPKA